MDTIKGNKIIAAFVSKQTGKKVKTDAKRLNYHSNWNSLMSARELVVATKADCGIGGGCCIRSEAINYDDYVETVTAAEAGSERLATWQSIVNYITWYEKQFEQNGVPIVVNAAELKEKVGV